MLRSKSLRWMTMLCVIALLSGCVSASYCQIAKPIWWADAQELDATPENITRQIVPHNETWEALCR